MARKIDDAGEVIEGAKKHLRSRVLDADIFSQMTDDEKVSLVTKDMIWKKPDYEKMVEDGHEPLACALIKIIRDRLASKPVQRRKDETYDYLCEHYIKSLSALRDLCNGIKTASGIRNNLLGSMKQEMDYDNRNNPDRIVDMWVIAKGRSCPFQVDYKDVRKAENMVSLGFPTEKIPSWKKGVSVHKSGSGLFYATKGNRILSRGQSEQEVWDNLQKQSEEKKSTRKQRDIIYERPHLSHLPESRSKDITPENFIDTFGFRGVQFGEWLPDSERQTVLNHAYDAFMDLASVLNIDPSMVSLDGTTAIAFGARGKGRAAAHYEPDQKVINLTRISGAGSLAHEWGHALDHYLGNIGHESALEGSRSRYASGGHERTYNRSDALPLLSNDLRKGIDGIMRSIYSKPIAESDRKHYEDRIESLRKDRLEHVKTQRERKLLINRNNEDAKARINRIFDGYVEQINTEADKEIRAIPEKYASPSDLYKRVSKMSEYYQRPTEMFARAFECVIFDALDKEQKSLQGNSPYLVNGVSPRELNLLSDDVKNPYPVAEDRKRINDAMFKFMEALKESFENKEDLNFKP